MPASSKAPAGVAESALRGLPYALAVLLLNLPTLGGCHHDARVGISGEVTWQGKPLQQGSLILEPMAAGPATGTEISGGRYTIHRTAGPAPGEYRVRIMAFAPTGRDIPDTDSPGRTQPEMKQIIPPEYNDRSDFRIQIPPGGGAVNLSLP